MFRRKCAHARHPKMLELVFFFFISFVGLLSSLLSSSERVSFSQEPISFHGKPYLFKIFCLNSNQLNIWRGIVCRVLRHLLMVFWLWYGDKIFYRDSAIHKSLCAIDHFLILSSLFACLRHCYVSEKYQCNVSIGQCSIICRFKCFDRLFLIIICCDFWCLNATSCELRRSISRGYCVTKKIYFKF